MKKTALVILVIALLFSSCGKERKIQPKLPVGDNAEDIPNFIMEGFTLVSTEEGDTSMTIKARGAQIFEMKKRAYAQVVEITHYDEDGKESKLFGDKAIINTETNSMEISGNVRGFSAEGMQLKTEKLYWDDTNKKMFTDAAVTIIKDGNVLKGVGFESDAGMKNLELNKSVELRAKNLIKEVD